MITFFCGRPGAGKSYSVVDLAILPAIRAGRPVRTNIPLRLEAIQRDWPDADVELLDEIHPGIWETIPGGALVVLDELWRYWPSGVKSNRVDKRDLSFIAEHRHRVGDVRGETLSTDIVLISQGSSDIAAFLRPKIAETVIVSKMTQVGQANRYRIERFSDFQDSERPKKGALIVSGLGTYRPEVYQYYVSHSQAKGSVDMSSIQEVGTTKRRTIFHSFRFRFFVVAFVLALMLLTWSAKRTADGIAEVTGTPAAAASQPVAAAPPPQQPAVDQGAPTSAPVPDPEPEPEPEPPKPRMEWFISGYAEVDPWNDDGEPDEARREYLLQVTHVQGMRRHMTVSGEHCRKRFGILECDLDGVELTEMPQRLSITAGVAPYME
ncbi:zonular occludens toxin domain-containing protein [Marichromatium gracile]|uniref:zonular occludens toxin domain-containing protein n=1 Tax=Marichromatium gracile TaxID=1048 RepID=UPI001F2E855E|nr:zonular occludens toxin domain-containing protein [Marichromatium gracile]MCF1183543.1 zonular occludens toxin domain-containing protein [Marichromatium gracile]